MTFKFVVQQLLSRYFMESVHNLIFRGVDFSDEGSTTFTMAKIVIISSSYNGLKKLFFIYFWNCMTG